MNFKRCNNCKEWYDKKGKLIVCSNCDNELFPIIKAYLKDNPGMNAKMISEGTNISEKIILSYLDDDRLQEVDETKEKSVCQSCGKEFAGLGKICKDCLQKRRDDVELLKKLQETYDNNSTHKDDKSTAMRHFKF